MVDVNKVPDLDLNSLYKLISSGDCSKLSAEQKTAYYLARCEQAGLAPASPPFEYLKLGGREVLYARKGATDQLARNNGIRLTILNQETLEGVRLVTVQALCPDGRCTEALGAVPLANLKGESLSNAYMKAVTKAKRRAILSVTGLGVLDELEVESLQRRGGPLPPMPTAEEQATLDATIPAPPGPPRPLPDSEDVSSDPATINPKQMALLMASAREAEVGPAELKAHLEEQGWRSRKDIPADRLEEVLEWLRASD